MAAIARWTTPSITYKPSAVDVAEVDKINGSWVEQGDLTQLISTSGKYQVDLQASKSPHTRTKLYQVDN